jgi:hypothetical protein
LQKTIPYFARRLQEENYSLAVSGEQ